MMDKHVNMQSKSSVVTLAGARGHPRMKQLCWIQYIWAIRNMCVNCPFNDVWGSLGIPRGGDDDKICATAVAVQCSL
jgi:hypothetical protein